MATVLELILPVSEPLMTYMLNWSSTAVQPRLETLHREICLGMLAALLFVQAEKFKERCFGRFKHCSRDKNICKGTINDIFDYFVSVIKKSQ